VFGGKNNCYQNRNGERKRTGKWAITWNVNNKDEDKVPFAVYNAMSGAVQTIKYLVKDE
jgi:hypothetical protein